MRKTILLLALLSGAAMARAETIRVETWRPATSDNAATLRSIQVEPIGGDAGDALTIQLEDSLRAIQLGEGAYFQVIPAATGSGGDALLRGVAYTEQRFSDYTEERERCIKDDRGNCTPAKEKITVKCRRRTIELVVELRLIAPDGTLLWSDNRPETSTDSRCEDQDITPRTRGAIARELSGKVSQRVRFDFAPSRAVEDVRVDEGRKGLGKDDANRFKAAVRSVKDGRVAEACASWGELAATYPDHVPTRYNLGLCAESAGDDAGAAGHYRHVLAIDPRHGASQRGLARLASRDRTRRQLQAHAGN